LTFCRGLNFLFIFIFFNRHFGQTIVGQTIVGQTIVGQTIVGQTIVGQTIVGQTIVGQTFVGQTLSCNTYWTRFHSRMQFGNFVLKNRALSIMDFGIYIPT
jgi:hypothetical protein